jgi:hypothetical protein
LQIGLTNSTPQTLNHLATPTWITNLQTRWKLNSVRQVIIVLIVFACTGFSVMFLKPVITELLFGEEKTTWFTIAYWVLILPVYNALLLFYGFIFGQFNFFWEFEKRMFSRMFGRKKLNASE